MARKTLAATPEKAAKKQPAKKTPVKKAPKPKTKQIWNPLGYYCAPNAASPHYTEHHDFENLIACGLVECWLGSSSEDPNADAHFGRPVDLEDVRDLRRIFLDMISNMLLQFWSGDIDPGEGVLDLGCDQIDLGVGGDEADPDHYVRWDCDLREDCIILTMGWGGDDQAIFLSYEAIVDREKVMETLRKAYASIDGCVDPALEKLVCLDEATLAEKAWEYVESVHIELRSATYVKHGAMSGRLDSMNLRAKACLLYTSPSPRDS